MSELETLRNCLKDEEGKSLTKSVKYLKTRFRGVLNSEQSLKNNWIWVKILVREKGTHLNFQVKLLHRSKDIRQRVLENEVLQLSLSFARNTYWSSNGLVMRVLLMIRTKSSLYGLGSVELCTTCDNWNTERHNMVRVFV